MYDYFQVLVDLHGEPGETCINQEALTKDEVLIIKVSKVKNCFGTIIVNIAGHS